MDETLAGKVGFAVSRMQSQIGVPNAHRRLTSDIAFGIVAKINTYAKRIGRVSKGDREMALLLSRSSCLIAGEILEVMYAEL